MAESVDRIAVADTRPNIFAVPHDGRDSVLVAATPAIDAAALTPLDGPRAAAAVAGRRWRPAAGLTVRRCLAVAVLLAAAMSALVLNELRSGRAPQFDASATRSNGIGEAIDAPRKAPTRTADKRRARVAAASVRARAAKRTAHQHTPRRWRRARERSSSPSVRPSRPAERVPPCCRRRSSMRAQRRGHTPSAAAPAAPAVRSPRPPGLAPAGRGERAVPAPVPADAPPEFM